MTVPSALLVDVADLETYLGQGTLDPDRAGMILRDAQDLAESILFPLPPEAAGIVRRIAGRGYVNITSAQQMGLGTANVTYGSTGAGGVGGVYLSRSDKADLRRLGGVSGGMFTVNVMPATAGQNLSWWNVDGSTEATDTWDTPL